MQHTNKTIKKYDKKNKVQYLQSDALSPNETQRQPHQVSISPAFIKSKNKCLAIRRYRENVASKIMSNASYSSKKCKTHQDAN